MGPSDGPSWMGLQLAPHGWETSPCASRLQRRSVRFLSSVTSTLGPYGAIIWPRFTDYLSHYSMCLSIRALYRRIWYYYILLSVCHCRWRDVPIIYRPLLFSRFSPTIKPGFHSNAIACVAWHKRKPQETQALALTRFSRNKRKRQPIGMLGRSSGNHDWLLANTSVCVSCGFRLRNARNASDCVWMETGLTGRASD